MCRHARGKHQFPLRLGRTYLTLRIVAAHDALGDESVQWDEQGNDYAWQISPPAQCRFESCRRHHDNQLNQTEQPVPSAHTRIVSSGPCELMTSQPCMVRPQQSV